MLIGESKFERERKNWKNYFNRNGKNILLNNNKKLHFQRSQNTKITKNLPTQKIQIDQKVKEYIFLIFILHRELCICWLVSASLREREKIERIILIETEKIFYGTKTITKNDIFYDHKNNKKISDPKFDRPKNTHC